MKLDLPSQPADSLVELFLLEPAHVTAEYVGWLNDPRVNRFLESRFRQHTLESTREFVRTMLQSDDNLLLGIRDKRLQGRHVGNIKLGPVLAAHGLGEVGIMVGATEAWGRGVAAAAIQALVDVARAQLGLRKLSAGCYADNEGSARAFLKAGFKVEGRRLAHVVVDGNPQDVLLLGRILNEVRPK